MESSESPKIFVGGISGETNEETLRDHFYKYGDVVESVIIRDRNTGGTRGFGFVLFSDPSSAGKALQDDHVISGRTVDVKRAIPREYQHNGTARSHINSNNGSSGNSNNDHNDCNGAQLRTKKIFVGGLPSNLAEEEFRAYFEKFGKTTDAVVMYDSLTNRPRGFGFVTFETEDAVDNVMQKNYHELNEKSVEVKRAVPKEGNLGNQCNASSRNSSGRGGYKNNYAPGIYSAYDPRYGFYPGYVLPPAFAGYGNGRIGMYPVPMGNGFVRGVGVGGYGGTYPIGGYGGIPLQAASYATGFTNGRPVRPPRSPWNKNPGFVSPRQSPGHFGNPIYSHPTSPSPGYINGSSPSTNPHFGDAHGASATSNGEWNHANESSKTEVVGNGEADSASQTESPLMDWSSSGFTGNCGAADMQNQESPDSHLRPHLDRVG